MTPPLAAPLLDQAVALRRRAALTVDDVDAANRRLDGAAPHEIVEWAVNTFGRRLVLTTSFSETTLIDIALGVDPGLEVVFLDTGYHFPETLDTMRHAQRRYDLELTVLRPDDGAPGPFGGDTGSCCAARKSTPLDRYLTAHADAWLSGMRRSDSPDRAHTPIVSLDRRGLVKVNPIVAMDDADYDAYNASHDVVVNTLRHDGFASIGCWPCTQRADDRSGRWAGSAKSECGLHL